MENENKIINEFHKIQNENNKIKMESNNQNSDLNKQNKSETKVLFESYPNDFIIPSVSKTNPLLLRKTERSSFSMKNDEKTKNIQNNKKNKITFHLEQSNPNEIVNIFSTTTTKSQSNEFDKNNLSRLSTKSSSSKESTLCKASSLDKNTNNFKSMYNNNSNSFKQTDPFTVPLLRANFRSSSEKETELNSEKDEGQKPNEEEDHDEQNEQRDNFNKNQKNDKNDRNENQNDSKYNEEPIKVIPLRPIPINLPIQHITPQFLTNLQPPLNLDNILYSQEDYLNAGVNKNIIMNKIKNQKIKKRIIKDLTQEDILIDSLLVDLVKTHHYLQRSKDPMYNNSILYKEQDILTKLILLTSNKLARVQPNKK